MNDKKGCVKKVYPGGNTSKGFYSYYNNIIDVKEANRFFIIKGGPGTGKSSFMKKISQNMIEKGYDVEQFFCSSDNGSLDGVGIPALKVAIIDGTSPHVVDPIYPGSIDEILNFGEFWDVDKMEMKKNKDDIVKSTTTVSKLFKRAYKFLAAAKSIRDDLETIYKVALDDKKFNIALNELSEELFKDLKGIGEIGKIRQLFGSAITPKGWVNHYDTIVEPMGNIYCLKGDYVAGMSKFMGEIVGEAVKKGLDVEIYYEALDAKSIETIIIPKLSVAITSSQKYRDKKVIDFDSFMSKDVLEEEKEAIKTDQQWMNQLIKMGSQNVAAAKAEHDVLEGYYVPNMDFEKIDEYRKQIEEKMLSYSSGQ